MSSPNIILVFKSRRMRWDGHVASVEGEERCTQGFGGETSETQPLGRPRRRWEDNIKIVFRKREGDKDWIDLAQDRGRCPALVKTVINFRVP
jgi:hypothetical protein